MRTRSLLVAVAVALIPATATAAKKTDATRAKAGLLRLADLPKGWTASKPASSDISETCSIIGDAKKATTARASSRDYDRGDTQSINHKVYVFPTAKEAGKHLTAFASRKLRVCLRDAIRRMIRQQGSPKGVVYGAIGIDDPLRVTGIGDQSGGSRVTLHISSGKQSATAVYDFVFARVGRTVSIMSFYSFAPDLDQEAKLAVVGARRIAAAMR